MTQLVIESAQRCSAHSSPMMNTDHLDRAVAEVMQLMLGTSFSLATHGVPTDTGSKIVTAVVGLAGSLSGACVLCAEDQVAMQMTSSMVGMEINTLDETVKDAMGEVCNMLAGAWKGRIPSLAFNCLLSVPTVVTGTDYLVHVLKPVFLMERNYAFRDRVFSVRIQGDPVTSS